MQADRLDPEWLRDQIIGVDHSIATPFGERRMLYADYTASGRGLHFIEDYLKRLQELYANSHTEDDTSGRVTTQLLTHAEQIIKDAVNAGPDGRIIAFGSGATAAIDRMQQLIGIKLPSASRDTLDQLLVGYFGTEQVAQFDAYCKVHQPVVFVGPYEHHSNEVTWREGLAQVVEVRLAGDGGIDLQHLETLLADPAYQGRLRIGSFSAASNVTGMKSPVHEIAALLHRYDALAFFDYAACAPYVKIDMNPERQGTEGDTSLDAIFVSPHKFLGGPGANGILVFNKRCYRSELPPSMAGGGTVDYVGPDDHDFIKDIEAREKGGTPGILQTWRSALAFQIKTAVGTEVIESREAAMLDRAFQRWGAHPGIEILGNPDPGRRIGIVSFNIRGAGGLYLHPRFVTCLLNDLFGIQSRAGCSCAGPYGHQLLGIDGETAQEFRAEIASGHCGIKPGWCRVGFHYVLSESEFEFLLDAVLFVADQGHLFTPLYHFDHLSGLWHHREWQEPDPRLSLEAALVAGSCIPESLPEGERGIYYREILAKAEDIARELAADYQEDHVSLAGEEGSLQFFQLPRKSIATDL